jgi:cellulose synthase/poly-beta-1,6-N-acetylglucosamine synthase-like glycosyltransferase
VLSFDGQGVELLSRPVRKGKAAAIRAAMAVATADVVVFSDANTSFQRDSIRSLARWFTDPKVGVVCGRLILVDAVGASNADGLYWKYETFLKRHEARLNALLGANGAIYAIRRECFVPVPDSTLVDDFAIPLLARLRHGCRLLYDPTAIALEKTSPHLAVEFTRRLRIGTGDWQSLGWLLQLLDPRQGWIALSLFSHKILRWLCPIFLIAAAISNALLASTAPYTTLMYLQVLFYSTAAAGPLLPGGGPLHRLARVSSLFVVANVAILAGFCRWISTSPSGTWQRTPR